MSIEVAIILATLLGPVLAVQAQKWIERATERRSAQKRIFYSLMSTRATRVAAEHVQALNMIDLEFGKSRWRGPSALEKVVLQKWRIYADHLNTPDSNNEPTTVRRWLERQDDLFTDLLEALAKALGYEFDQVQLRRGIYYPRAHGEAERRREVFEQALVKIFTGQESLPMKVTEFPVSDEAAALQKLLQERVVASYTKDGALRVKQED